MVSLQEKKRRTKVFTIDYYYRLLLSIAIRILGYFHYHYCYRCKSEFRHALLCILLTIFNLFSVCCHQIYQINQLTISSPIHSKIYQCQVATIIDLQSLCNTTQVIDTELNEKTNMMYCCVELLEGVFHTSFP